MDLRSIRARDHLGNEYPSMSAMSKVYGKYYQLVSQRLDKGLSIEDALTAPIVEHGKSACKACKDHLGNEFSSIKEMCAAHNITYSCYISRRKAGYSLEDALTGNMCGYSTPVQDHLGNWYPSVTDMCDHYNIPISTYSQRVNRYKMSVEDALTRKVRPKSAPTNAKPCRDHLGNMFSSKKEMAAFHKIKYAKLEYRLRKKMKLEDALKP